MKTLFSKFDKGHWFGLGVALALAVVPVLASHEQNFAGVAPSVLAALAIVKHAVDTAEAEDSAQ